MKDERIGLRRVPMRQVSKLEPVTEVAEAMFGTDHDRLLRVYLAARDIDPCALDLTERLAWKDSGPLAQMIDGNALAAAAGLGDHAVYLPTAREAAEALGRWHGSALELWVAFSWKPPGPFRRLSNRERRRGHFPTAAG